MQFSIVTPLVPQHDNYFFDLLVELSIHPDKVGEVIASRSSGSIRSIATFKEKLDAFLSDNVIPFPVTILYTTETLLAGENRNRAWALANYEYVVFCDADDSYSPFRLLMLEEAISLLKPDLLLHDYFSGGRPPEYLYKRPDDLEYVLSKELFESTFLGVPRNRSKEGEISGDTNLRVPFKLNNHVKIHHAHSCVKNNLRDKFQFGTTFRAEDGQFCRDILESQHSVVYIPWELSTWVYSRSTAPTSRLQTFRKVLNRIKKAFASRY
jgi:glycosyltransferase involved in cell wall biosynthesis